jgi:polyisoprenyl-phosphate glycosyltransferase
MKRLRVIVPVFNDWEAFGVLLSELDHIAGKLPISLAVIAIDDGSTIEPGAFDSAQLQHLARVEIVHLHTNLGHQRAIAVGLCIAADDNDADGIVVMDGDGEDAPAAIARLLHCAADAPNFCVVAQRGRRSEGPAFRLSYIAYKTLFKLMTGCEIRFGNFCLLSAAYVRRLVSVSELWNNLPAAILRSRLPIREIPIDRAKRYAGKSKMNLTSLVVHGLSGISVYAETIFVRLLFLTLGLSLFSGVAIVTVLTLRLFYPLHATPGWATTVIFGVSMILAQTLSFTLLFVILLLNSRVQRLVIPIADYKPYVASRQLVSECVLRQI